MTTSELVKAAELLHQPSDGTAKEFEKKREMLAAEMNRIMSARSDLDTLIGAGNKAMMEDNHRNHARFISSVFAGFQPEVLVETVLWVFRAYRSHGFQLTYWPAQLDQWIEVLRTHLTTDAFREVYPFYNWMIIHQPSFVSESDKLMAASGPPAHEK